MRVSAIVVCVKYYFIKKKIHLFVCTKVVTSRIVRTNWSTCHGGGVVCDGDACDDNDNEAVDFTATEMAGSVCDVDAPTGGGDEYNLLLDAAFLIISQLDFPDV